MRAGGGGARQHTHAQDFVCGAGAAAAETVITFPIAKLILRQQLHAILLPAALRQLRSEGASRLYRGLLPPLLQKVSSRAVMFGMYSEYQRALGCSGDRFGRCHALAALLAGATETCLCPFERVHVLLGADLFHHRFKNTAHAFSQLLREHGARELYRGWSAILLRNGPSNVLFFGLRVPIQQAVAGERSGGARQIAGHFVSGAVLGATLSTVFYPLNVVKTRMQSRCGGPLDGIGATAASVWRDRGRSVAELFRGVHLNFTRSLLTWGLTNVMFELLERFYTSRSAAER